MPRLECRPGNSSHRSLPIRSDVSMDSLSDDKPAQEDRSVLSAHIKTLEATLATLPITPHFATKHRVSLEEEIILAKKRIMVLKPVGPGSTRADKHSSVPRNVNRKHTLATVTLEKGNTEATTLAEDLFHSSKRLSASLGKTHFKRQCS